MKARRLAGTVLFPREETEPGSVSGSAFGFSHAGVPYRADALPRPAWAGRGPG